jgi:hypothetical protein
VTDAVLVCFCLFYIALVEEIGGLSDDLRHLTGELRGTGAVLSCVPTASFLHGLVELYESLARSNRPPPVVGRRAVGDIEVVQVLPRPGLWNKATNPTV